jgi:hypothetical protein
MNQINASLFRLASAIALALPMAAQAADVKDFQLSEMNYTQQVIEQRCNAQAAASVSDDGTDADRQDENLKAYQACIKPFYDGMQELIALQRDPSVSVAVWSDCRSSSNFATTQDFHAWATCIVKRKVSK